MRYQELLDEYSHLLRCDVQMRQQMQRIPKGYVVTKRISGRDYFYLQYSVQGKKKSEYIREDDVPAIKAALAEREPLKLRIAQNRGEQERLVRAAQILDTNLYRIFLYLKQCADMDAMPVARRLEALSFARAMTALEGLPAKEETEDNLRLWAKGEMSFADIYLNALRNYRVVEVTQ